MRIGWKPLVWGLFIVLLLSMLLGALLVRYYWHEVLQQNHIESLEWQGLGLSFSGIAVRELSLNQTQPTRDIALKARELALSWQWPGRGNGWLPQLTTLKTGYLELDWQVKPGPWPSAEPQKQSQWPPELPTWLPSEVGITQFKATLPCETGRCPLAGSLSITTSSPASVPGSIVLLPALATFNERLPIKANVNLNHEGHQVDVSATLDSSLGDDLRLSAQLAIDGTQYLTAETGYSHQNETGLVFWNGAVEMPDLPETDWLIAWLQTWYRIPAEQWPEHPETGLLNARWRLQGPGDRSFLTQVTGSVEVSALIPKPWPAPALGMLSGNIEVAVNAEGGIWTPGTLQADLELSHPGAWVKNIPELMQPESLSLSVRPGKAITPEFAQAKKGDEQAFLPLNIELNSHGGANVAINSHLAVATRAPWRAQLGHTQLTATLPELEVAGWQLTRPRARVTLTGYLDRSNAALEFGKGTVFEVDKLDPAGGAAAAANDLQLKGLVIRLAQTTLKADYRADQGELDNFSLSGPLALMAEQIKHPQLHPLSWEFNGKVNSSLSRAKVVGLLKAQTGTAANLDLNVPYQGPLQLEGQMRVSGTNEAEALSGIFTAWPPLLEVSGGTVSADVTYEQPHNGAMHLAAKLAFSDWSGTYDRTAWSRMNGVAEFVLENDRIEVATPELTIGELNPGLPVGPVHLAGEYKATVAQPAAGTLILKRADTDALAGWVAVQPGRWDLAEAPVTIPVELHQLSLAQLLQLYPAEGVYGTGVLSGTLPVLFDPANGIRVENGHLGALKPGGRLQLTAERLKLLASQNEAMKLVAQALEDFRYTVLDSGIDYDEDGTLLLKLQLKGNSPEVGKGQPIVLNINLEENIPALLTSLQLSGKVSDAVSERVKELLRKRESE